MANSHPDSATAVAWIKAQSPDWTKNNAQLVAWLNGLTVANPVPQPQIPRPMVALEMMVLVTTTDLAQADPFMAGANGFLDFLNTQNRTGVLDWVENLAAVGKITSDERTALLTYINGTIPDPFWSATVQAVEAPAANGGGGLGRLVDGEDVQAARTSQ